MAVNENVYGTPAQWVTAGFQQAELTQKNKWAYFREDFPSFSLASGVSAEKLSYSAGIDKSLSYCGLGEESALSHIAFVTTNSGGVTAINDTNERQVTNFAFFAQPRNIDIFQTSQYGTSTLNFFTWETAGQGQSANYNGLLAPYTIIRPKNLVFLLMVRAADSNYNNSISVDFDTYINTYTQTRPNIIQVYLQPYIGNIAETSNRDPLGGAGYNQNFVPFQLALLDKYEIETLETAFYAYDLWYMPIFGNFTNSASKTNNSSTFQMIAFTRNSREHIEIIQGGQSLSPKFCTKYYAEFQEDILKTAACFGLYFTTKTTVAYNGALTNNDMYIGILDADGIGHGRYLRGAETVNAPQNEYNDMHETGYDYTKNEDNTKYRNDTQFYAGYGTSSFTKFYALTETQVNQLSQELYRIANDVPASTPITEYNMKMFLTNNPIDCIISLKKFPVENIPLASSDATIYLGAKATNITGKILATPTWVYYFNFKNSENQSCFPYFGGNFLDYEPYTKCKIVIPFCGTVDVPVSYIYQYDDLQIALVMDFITGATTAYVKVNGITIDSITGSCAIDLPVSGIQSATLDSQIHSVAMAREKQQTTLGTGLIAGAVSIGIGLATGSLPVAIGGGAAIIGSFMHASDTGKQINYDLSHMETPVKQVTAASGQIAHTYDMRCKMVITRPEIAAEYSAEAYSKTIGFACLENGEVQHFHGLTVANIDLSGISCTAQEKEMIRAAFASGVYLPAEYSDTYWT